MRSLDQVFRFPSARATGHQDGRLAPLRQSGRSPPEDILIIAVIFEVVVADGRREEYLDIAAQIRPLLKEQDGFISIERFQSLADQNKLLSLSLWRDEESVGKWRTQVEHSEAQRQGRGGVFKDYPIRVAAVTRDYGMFERSQAPQEAK